MDEKQKATDPNLDPNEKREPAVEPVASDVTPTDQTSADTVEDTAVAADSAPVEEATPARTMDDEEYAESSMMPMIVGAIILALVAIAAVWFFTSNDQAGDDLAAQVGSAVSPETEGDPDDVMATVNGVDLTRAEYNRIRQQVLQNAQMMGMNINDPETQAQVDAQAIDTLINTELIRQAAVAAGASANSEEIEARFADIVAQVGGEEALENSLAQLGLTESSLRADIEQELIIQSYLESSIDTDDLAATDAEVDELYEASGGAEGGLPPIDEVRPQIERQIVMNKENELINELVEALRADADIEILL